MARRKVLQIAVEVLDQFLPGTAASAAFDQGGLLDQLKKALAERAPNAGVDLHLVVTATVCRAVTHGKPSKNPKS